MVDIDNFNPNIWGPKLWFIIETIALGYPVNPTNIDKDAYKSFFYSLQYILPCKTCRNSFRQHLLAYPISNDVLEDKYTFIKWTNIIHNNIRHEQGHVNVNLNSMIEYYKNIYNNKNEHKDMNKNYIYTFILIIIIIFVILGVRFIK